MQAELAVIDTQLAAPNLWDDAERASQLTRKHAELERTLNRWLGLDRAVGDAAEMAELADAEQDADLLVEVESELESLLIRVERTQLELMLNGDADGFDCFIEVHAGAGGTESQDWTEMLARMYARWAERHAHEIELIAESPGEEAGMKSVTMRFSGTNCYGWLKHETGVHRLVRISPFDANSRRHTSFASVTVYPALDDSIEVEVLDKDLRVDTYRASGAGGQHVNKTDSAVRITHLPTGMVVQCQSSRSQHKNRAEAHRMLRSRLYEIALREREEQAQTAHKDKSDIAWGNQIRSYVLQPYQMVKDLRTGTERGNAQGVLDGDIDPFLEAALSALVS